MKKKKFYYVSLLIITVFVIGIYFSGNLNNYINKNSVKCKGCNLVLIDLDVVRFDAIDCVNNYDLTPNICKLKFQSVSFNNHANQSSQTITSFVTTMTSIYPSSHNVWNEIYSTDLPGIKYMAQVLDDNSYNTALAGHVVDFVQVVDKGYQKVIDARHIYSTNFKPLDWVNDLNNSKQPFFLHIYLDDTHFPYLLLDDQVVQNPYPAPIGIPRTESEYVKMQEDYVTKNYKKIFTDQAINENQDLFSGDLDSKKGKILAFFTDAASKAGKVYLVKDAWAPTRDTFFQNFDQENPEHVDYLKANYLGILHLVDQQLKPLISLLTSDKYKRNTIIVFKTAHGEEFLEHGLFQHGNDLYQEIIHTPFIISIPGVAKKEVDSLTEDVDFMPTILDILDIPIPAQVQGKSLLPVITGFQHGVRDYQLAQKGDLNYVSIYRKGDWKVLIKKDTPIALYNLTNDLGEKDNLINSNKSVAWELYQDYHSVTDPLPKYAEGRIPYPSIIDEEKRQRLRDEGYF